MKGRGEVFCYSAGLDSKSTFSWPWCSSCTQRRRLVFGPRITLVDLHSRLMPTVAVAAVLEHGTSSLRRPILDLKSHAEVCMYLAELCADPPIFASMLFVSSTRTTLPAKAHIRSAYVSRDSRPKFSIGVRRTVCRQIPKAGAGPATSADTASHARGWMLWVSCIVPAARASLCEAWTGSAASDFRSK